MTAGSPKAAVLLFVVVLLALPASAAGHGEVTHHDLPTDFPTPLAEPAAGGTLADTWCGTVRSTDDREHEVGPLDAPKIKVGIALAVGQPLDPAWANLAQHHARLAYEHVLAESGGTKSIRFDLGTDCGPGYLDLQVVAVPPGNGAIGSCPFDSDVEKALTAPGRAFNFLAFYFVPGCTGGGGHAEISRDDSPGERNLNNKPGQLAVNGGDERPMVSLHEIGHTLGAIQVTAPHTDATWHCWDHADVMCYPYTAAAPQSPVRPCAWGKVLDPFDCGKDDYFSADPAPGSYLATHWNVYDSVFLCAAAQCVPPEPQPSRGPAPAEVAPAPPPPPAPGPPAPVAGQTAQTPPPAAAKRKPASRPRRAALRRCRKLKSRRAQARCRRAVARRYR